MNNVLRNKGFLLPGLAVELEPVKTEAMLLKSDVKKYAVPALDKGLDVLEYLTGQVVPKTQTEIAQGIGRSANEIYRVLVGLEARGYVMRDDLSGRYRLSFKLYNLSRGISPIDQVRQCALPHMEDLAVAVGQSCYLSMLYQSQAMVIVQARSQAQVSINVAEGFTFSTISSAAGLVLLANSNSDVKAMILERDKLYGKFSKRKRDELEASLLSIRENGHCVFDSESAIGVREVTALIGQQDGKVIASLTLSVITRSIDESLEINRFIQHVVDVANKITAQLEC